ncbi:MAG: hypothetical protein A3J67_03235 [Parcubacteria group bacterium RIFCSPHIGHO2_02_FULL_48_10b]|nr:MAG: hypothetical protein A3J67_03235 [Parcubacteria group bacterium RIFCSPHIGHO2_02_FULL_48_10b]
MLLVNWKKELNIFAILFLGMIMTVYAFINFGAFFHNIRYRYLGSAPTSERILEFGRTTGAISSIPEIQHNELTAASLSAGNEADTVVSGTPSTDIKKQSVAPSSGSNYRLVIEKISVNAPIVFTESENTDAVLASLEKGVGLYPGSDLPGSRGRGVILGHS